MSNSKLCYPALTGNRGLEFGSSLQMTSFEVFLTGWNRLFKRKNIKMCGLMVTHTHTYAHAHTRTHTHTHTQFWCNYIGKTEKLMGVCVLVCFLLLGFGLFFCSQRAFFSFGHREMKLIFFYINGRLNLLS